MLRFNNKVFHVLALLFIAQSFNDLWSVEIGLPTPVQCVIVYSFFALPWKPANTFERGFIVFLILYLIVVALSSLYVADAYGLDLTVATIAANLIILLRIIPNVRSNDLVGTDINKFLTVIQYTVLIVTIPSGLFELITHQNILRTEYGLADTLFYLRGFHIDKLEFGCYLIVGAFISILRIGTMTVLSYKGLLNLLIIICSVTLLAFSYSSTSILGFILGGTVISFALLRHRRVAFSIFLFLSIGIVALLVDRSDLFSEQKELYKLKYSLNVQRYSEKNYRWLSFWAAFDQFQRAPLFGYGIGRSAIELRRALDFKQAVNAHNLFANELVDFGIVGFLPLFIFLVKVYRINWRCYARCRYLPSLDQSFVILTTALGLFLLARLILYYHRFDQSFYVIWIAMVFFCVSFIQKEIFRKKLEYITHRQTA